MLKGVDLAQPPILDFDQGSKSGTFKNQTKSSIEPDQPQEGYQQIACTKKFTDLIAFETRS